MGRWWMAGVMVIALVACGEDEAANSTSSGSASGGTGAGDVGGGGEQAGTLAIITTEIAPTRRGRRLDAPIEASGGDGEYQWSLLEGPLPGGLSLGADGNPTQLAGIATEAGQFPITVEVTDGSGATTTQDFTVEVSETGLLVYTADAEVDGSPDAYLVDTDATTSAPQRLSDSASEGGVVAVAWSPHASHAAYRTSQGLYLVDLSGPSPVTHPVAAEMGIDIQVFQFSPDGRMLIFRKKDPYEVYVVYLDDDALTPVRLNPATPDGTVTSWSWSPDGDRIIVQGNLFGEGLALAVIDMSGAMPSAPVALHPALTAPQKAVGAHWAPDGQRVAFRADLDTPSQSEVWVVDLAGGVPGPPMKVSPPLSTNVDAHIHDWLPAGNSLLIETDEIQNGFYDMYWIDMSGGTPAAPVRVTPSYGHDVPGNGQRSVYLSPDGLKVALVGYYGTTSGREVYYFDTTTPDPAIKVHGPLPYLAHATSPSFSGDSTMLAFLFEGGGGFTADLTLHDVSQGTLGPPVVVNSNMPEAEEVVQYRFRPDNSGVAFAGGKIGRLMQYAAIEGGVPAAPQPLSTDGGFFSYKGKLAWHATHPRLAYTGEDNENGVAELMLTTIENGAPTAPIRISQDLTGTAADVEHIYWAP